MDIKIALAGNPNSGKTTLFNALTGSNQFIGNWPGVTVEKKEGKPKKKPEVTIIDLPGIYSLSPYTLEEVIARDYLVNEKPDVILNIVDATNLERNLYLTTQLLETGIPVVVALNMMDIVKKEKDLLNTSELSRKLGCRVVEISALKGHNITIALNAAIEAAQEKKTVQINRFNDVTEKALSEIEEVCLKEIASEHRRWYAVKLFERDEKVREEMNFSPETLAKLDEIVKNAEKELDDDSECIITNDRYEFITETLKGSYQKTNAGKLTVSDKIDRIVTNRWLALPIFAIIICFVYFISVMPIEWSLGTYATDWINESLFGDGYHLLWIGSKKYAGDNEPFQDSLNIVNGAIEWSKDTSIDTSIDTSELEEKFKPEDENFDPQEASVLLNDFKEKFKEAFPDGFEYSVINEETLQEELREASIDDLEDAAAILEKFEFTAPDPGDYGVWVPGIPVVTEKLLDAVGCKPWLKSLIIDGIIAGVGAVLGFLPQLFVLFICLALLELCGYMSRIAFVLDRIFRKFGLSGKSFIPMLIGMGCGVPGIMASRTIENERDRRMTIITTTFIPCSAKIPFITMMGIIFTRSWWVAPIAYFLGMGAIIVSGIILKKTKMFAGEPAPFVMELPAYRWPSFSGVMRSTWERCYSFIKKAGTIILLSTIVIWFTSRFGFMGGKFVMLEDSEIENSLLAYLGKGICLLFAPLGFGTWQATVATITGLVAKENIVVTMIGVYGHGNKQAARMALINLFSRRAAFAFLIFNLLCAPCFAAMGAIKREMNNGKWMAFAIIYQCVFAYVIALIFYQFASLFTGNLKGANIVFFIIAAFLLVLICVLLFRPYGDRKAKESAT